jgi:hypothetical protein
MDAPSRDPPARVERRQRPAASGVPGYGSGSSEVNGNTAARDPRLDPRGFLTYRATETSASDTVPSENSRVRDLASRAASAVSRLLTGIRSRKRDRGAGSRGSVDGQEPGSHVPTEGGKQ